MQNTSHSFLVKRHTKQQVLSKEDLENKMSEIDEQINTLLLRKAEILLKLKELESDEFVKP